MSKSELILYKWKTLKDETNPIMLRISKKNERKMLSTGLSCTPKQWNDEYGLFVRDKRLVKDYEALNTVLTNTKTKADKIIKEFDRLEIDWTMKQFENKYLLKSVNLNPADYFESHIQKMVDAGRFGNADVFRSTLKILTLFDKKFNKLKFPDIDLKYITKFDSFLRNERKIKDTSISFYMRTFATLINSAISDNLMQPESYPFKTKHNKGYQISKLNVETKKRFIPGEYLTTLKNFNFEDLRLETARNLFLFSFYCRGINWIDMANLTTENIKNEMTQDGKPIKVLKFIRTKTHKPFEIIINSDIQNLLDWFNIMPHCKSYLLPIVTKPDYKGDIMRHHIKDKRNEFNKALINITAIEALKFPDALKNITSYYSRHSYAMVMRDKGVSIELISEALGHADLKTTNVYLDSFGREEVANASENLI